jgi:hypothetical protein
LADNELSPFIRELTDLQEKFTKDKATYQAYRFLEQALRQALAVNKIAKEEIGTLCLQAEQHLGKLLAECAFLSTYELATIREIQVRKGKREAVASFLHENAVLRGTVDKTANIYALPREDYTENQSVIVSKNLFGKEKTLNLSPFIIDINAFSLKKQNLPDLHFWYGTDEKGQLCYQRISQMQDFFQVEKESDDAELMLSTFSVKYEGMDMLYELLDNFKTDLKLS